MKKVLMIAVVLFALLAAWFGIYTYSVRQNDLKQRNSLEHSIAIAVNRLPQAHDFFLQNRHKLELLSLSEELHTREVTILPGLLISVADDMLWWPQQWDEIPWLTAELEEAALALLLTDTPGAHDVSIVFSESSMNFTLFATPLHAVLHGQRPHAWVVISYGETLTWSNRGIVHTEPLESGFHLTITSEQPRNEARVYLLITILFAALSLVSLVVLIWGIKTYRFMVETDTTFRTVLILGAVVVFLVLITYIFFGRVL